MSRLKPAIYDFQMRLARRRLDPRRRSLVAGSSGRVLELGIGTGQNLRFYASATYVIGVDPDLGMLRRAQPRGSAALARVHLVGGTGEALPFRDGSFSEVVAALVF